MSDASPPRFNRTSSSSDEAQRRIREAVSRETTPLSLDEFVGQEPVVAALKRAAAGASLRQEPLPHVLLSGGPGLGKSSLCRALAAEVGSRLHATSATLLRCIAELIRHLCTLRDRDILFIDALHRLPASLSETLYEAMQDGRISDLGLTRRLAPFTLVGATTDEDLLPEAFRSRFPIKLDRTPCRVRHPAPELGAHGHDILGAREDAG